MPEHGMPRPALILWSGRLFLHLPRSVMDVKIRFGDSADPDSNGDVLSAAGHAHALVTFLYQ